MNLFKSLFGNDNVETLTAQEAGARLNGNSIDNEKPLLVLDVRQPDEYRTGHIQGAKLIPLNELSARLDELPDDQEILCVCRTGARSGMAAGQLASAGYKAFNLSGGMVGWQRAGLAVKKD